MELDLARRLVRLVNDPEMYPLLQEYVQSRISVLQAQLETEASMDKIRGLQRTISELRRFSTLKEEVQRAANG